MDVVEILCKRSCEQRLKIKEKYDAEHSTVYF